MPFSWRHFFLLVASPVAGAALVSSDAKWVQDALHAVRVECPIKALQGKLFCRISAHVYNSDQEYEALAIAVDGLAP